MLVSERGAARRPLVVEPISSPVGLPSQGKVGARLLPGAALQGLPPDSFQRDRTGSQFGDGARQCSPSAAVLGQAWAAPGPGYPMPQDPLFPAAEISVPEKVCGLQDCGPHALHEQLEKVSVAVQAFLPSLGVLKPSRYSYTGL